MSTTICSIECSEPFPPPRGFPESEFIQRLEMVQKRMKILELDTLFLSTEPEIRYFTGFFSPFWESPTRPWFLIIRVEDFPIAVIPEIGRYAFQEQTWLPSENIISWSSPQPEDDGVTLTSSIVLNNSQLHKSVGVPIGRESRIGMPFNDFNRWKGILKEEGISIHDISELIKDILNIKSAREIEKIEYISRITSETLNRLSELYRPGDTERDLARKVRVDLISRGVDTIRYLSVASGPDGYKDITSHPSDRMLMPGDVFYLDIGTLYDGYFCDFDRHLAIGEPSEETKKAYRAVHSAQIAGIEASVPGNSLNDIFEEMYSVMYDVDPDETCNGIKFIGEGSTGRMGHGVGLRLTEGFSVKKSETLELSPGMVIAIEPGGVYLNKHGEKVLMVHEENIVVTESDGPKLLSNLASEEIPVYDINLLGILIFKTDFMTRTAISEMLSSSTDDIFPIFSVIDGPGELTIENFRTIGSQYIEGMSIFPKDVLRCGDHATLTCFT